jgi:glutamate-1-semialdehyde 2,1-aminomutase
VCRFGLRAVAQRARRADELDPRPDAHHVPRDAVGGDRELQAARKARNLPWHAVRVGARVEFICAAGPLRNGTEAEAAHAPALEQAIHLALLNRGCLIAPFHNMMLVSPATTAAQVERLRQAFESVVASLALDFGSWQ